MMVLSVFADSSPCFDRLAMAMLHFLWQGILIAAVLFILESLFNAVSHKGTSRNEPVTRAFGSRSSTRIRYALNVVALTLLASCVPVTYLWLEVSAPKNALLAASARIDAGIEQQVPDSEVVEVDFRPTGAIVPTEFASANDNSAVPSAIESDELLYDSQPCPSQIP